MTRDDIIRMARKANLHERFKAGVGYVVRIPNLENLERFAALVAAAEREKVAHWMMGRGYATGHGDTVEDLLKELEWQILERERERMKAKGWRHCAEGQRTTQYCGLLEAAVKAEREACARLCENFATTSEMEFGTCIECAEAIRKRK